MDTPGTQDANPYAPPQSQIQGVPGDTADLTQEASYYAMSVSKLIIMCVLTAGLYHLCFWWRQWRHQRDHNGVALSVFWRTVFSPFMYFGFNSPIVAELKARNLAAPALLSSAPIIYFVFSAIDRALSRVDEFELPHVLLSWAVFLVIAACLASTQAAINSILAAEGYKGPVNRGITWGSVVMACVGLCLWSFLVRRHFGV